MRRLLSVNDVIKSIEKSKGARVKAYGWLHSIRRHSNVVFYDVRYLDSYLQCVLDDLEKDKPIRLESFVRVEGIIREREEELVNNKIKGGKYEVKLDRISVISKSPKKLPFSCKTKIKEISSENSLIYRSFFLRKQEAIDPINKRMEFIKNLRIICEEYGMKECLTPIISNPTTDGAKEFIVPSRLHPGKSYALPQSPQQYKQLLMSAGIDRYYQVAPCFRDEDIRADRYSGEFYQLDFEMALVIREEEIMKVAEDMFLRSLERAGIALKPIIREEIDYDDAIRRFSSDKPDLRFGFELKESFDDKNSLYCKYFEPEFKAKDLFSKAKKAAKNVFIIDEEGLSKGSKPIPEELKNRRNLMGIISFNKEEAIRESKALYEEAKKHCKPSDKESLVWVRNFPMFVLGEDQKVEFAHNPFCMPKGFDEARILETKAMQYDLVLNGKEIGSGSIRNHKIKLLKKIIGYQNKLKEYGNFIRNLMSAPPHGGFALGIERALFSIMDCQRISDFYLFPLDQRRINLTLKAPVIVKN